MGEAHGLGASVLISRYTSPTALALAKAALESAGVPFEVRGETLVTSAAIYGFFAAELWVPSEHEHAAREAVHTSEGMVDAAPWSCGACGEENPATFASCWSCGAEFSASPPADAEGEGLVEEEIFRDGDAVVLLVSPAGGDARPHLILDGISGALPSEAFAARVRAVVEGALEHTDAEVDLSGVTVQVIESNVDHLRWEDAILGPLGLGNLTIVHLDGIVLVQLVDDEPATAIGDSERLRDDEAAVAWAEGAAFPGPGVHRASVEQLEDDEFLVLELVDEANGHRVMRLALVEEAQLAAYYLVAGVAQAARRFTVRVNIAAVRGLIADGATGEFLAQMLLFPDEP